MSDIVDYRSDYADHIMYEAELESIMDRFERWAKKAEKMGKKNWCGEGYRVYVNGSYETFAITRRKALVYAKRLKKEDPSRIVEVREGIL